MTSATVVRDPFRYHHRQSPAGELSDKVIHTLRRNLESYVRTNPPFFVLSKSLKKFRVHNPGIIIILHFAIRMVMLMMMNYLNVVVDLPKIRIERKKLENIQVLE